VDPGRISGPQSFGARDNSVCTYPNAGARKERASVPLEGTLTGGACREAGSGINESKRGAANSGPRLQGLHI
jgi:hypothetical protein